ncbi:hypothetical protein R8Z50_18750 [Longispora sp. K20-0274]|uniref:hypothetical protein n=1 Tax=Longispora sp. K20-0274 TaxID=3088255 RepID=UPI00399994A6
MVQPQWSLVTNVPERPYRSPEHAHRRGLRIFPAGAKVHFVGGFAGMGYETITVVGYGRGGRGRAPIVAHVAARHLPEWRIELVYRPAILRLLDAESRWPLLFAAMLAVHVSRVDLAGDDYKYFLASIAAPAPRVLPYGPSRSTPGLLDTGRCHWVYRGPNDAAGCEDAECRTGPRCVLLERYGHADTHDPEFWTRLPGQPAPCVPGSAATRV